MALISEPQPTHSGAGSGDLARPLPFAPEAGESNKAFEAFLCYFDIGEKRTPSGVSQLTGIHVSTIKRWINRYQWKERIRAYNTEILRNRLAIETEKHQDLVQQWVDRAAGFKEREWQAAEALLILARKHIDALLQTEPGKLSLGDIARALEVASKIGRLATGLATEKQEHTGANGGPIRLEIEAALDKIYGRALPGEVVEAEEVQSLECRVQNANGGGEG